MSKKLKYSLLAFAFFVFFILIGIGIHFIIEKNNLKKILMNFDIPNKNSALILDINQNGMEILDIESGIHFDFDNNNFAESTGWPDRNEGILAQDINKNHIIDNGNEIFGNNTHSSSSNKINGFEKLKLLDQNNDGKLDENDPGWHNILIWIDRNRNGLTGNNELFTLAKLKIKEISLDYKLAIQKNNSQNVIGLTSLFKKDDNSTGQIAEIWFDTDYANTIDMFTIKIPEDIKKLPQIHGFGNVHNLHIAMTLDTSGQLKELIEQYIQETDISLRLKMLDTIIFYWTGVQNVSPDSRKPDNCSTNPIHDARYLESLELFMGKKYTNNNFTDSEKHNPGEEAAKYLLEAYNLNKKYVKNALETQTHCHKYLMNITLTWNSKQRKWIVDTSKALEILNQEGKDNPQNIQQIITNLQDILEERKGSHSYVPEIFKDIRKRANSVPYIKKYILSIGLKKDNTQSPKDPPITNVKGIITGNDKDNILIGTSTTKEIYGKKGNDIIIGGSGNNFLHGGDGTDKYVFAQNWVHDIIDNISSEVPSNDCIIFGNSFSPETILIKKQKNDLKIYSSDNLNSITIKNYFLDNGTTSYTINCIKFSNGNNWNYKYIKKQIDKKH